MTIHAVEEIPAVALPRFNRNCVVFLLVVLTRYHQAVTTNRQPFTDRDQFDQPAGGHVVNSLTCAGLRRFSTQQSSLWALRPHRRFVLHRYDHYGTPGRGLSRDAGNIPPPN